MLRIKKELWKDFIKNHNKLGFKKKRNLETLSFLTSSENITSSTKTAVEELHRNVSNMLLQKENEYLKDYIKKLTIEEKSSRCDIIIPIGYCNDYEILIKY